MEKFLNAVETGLIILGSTLGLANIETIMGIILLVIQFVLVIVKIALHIKNGNYEQAIDEIEDITEELKKKGE